jgi:hypothetical protein
MFCEALSDDDQVMDSTAVFLQPSNGCILLISRASDLGACLTNVRLLRPARSGIFLRSFRLHSAHYARETIAKICSLGAALATAPISQTGS